MNAIKVLVTICNIFVMAMFIQSCHVSDRSSLVGTLFVELVFVFNILLIWS